MDYKKESRCGGGHTGVHLRYTLAGILLLIIVLGINNYAYISKCDEPFAGDNMAYLMDSIRHYNNGYSILSFLSFNRSFGIFALGNILYQFFPICQFTAISTNLIFAFFLLSATYFITFKICKDNIASMYSAVLLLLYPVTFGLSRYYMPDFSLMAMVTVFIALLLYSDEFRSTKYSIIGGITLGLGVMFKESFWVFVFAPVAYKFYLVLKNKAITIRKKNILLFLFMFVVFAGFWFLLHPIGIFNDVWHAVAAQENFNNPRVNFLFYLYPIIDLNISPSFFILFAIFFLLFLKKKHKETATLLLWILVPYIIFSFFPRKLARYLSPIAPAIAIITSVGLCGMRFRYRKLIYAVTIIFGVIQFVGVSYETPFLKRNFFIETKFLARLFNLTPTRYREDFYVGPPRQKETKGEEIIEILAKQACNYGKTHLSICRVLNIGSEDYKDYKDIRCFSGRVAVGAAGLRIEHPLSSSLGYYNLSKGYNYTIRDCFVNNKGELVLWPSGQQAGENEGQFDIVLIYEPGLIKCISHPYVFFNKLKLSAKETLHFYMNSSIIQSQNSSKLSSYY